VIGEWRPLDDPRPSALIDNKKWIGPTWAHVDSDLILRFTPAKTKATSAAEITLDLCRYPMVMEELASINDDARKGPLVVNPKTGVPYRQWYYRDLWRTIATVAGIERTVWNRDLRAGGITEARAAGAPMDDVAMTAGHNDKRTTARVYDRDRLEAARRVATAVSNMGEKNEP
jgi:integrase